MVVGRGDELVFEVFGSILAYFHHQHVLVPKMEESCTLFSAVLGMGIPLHKPK